MTTQDRVTTILKEQLGVDGIAPETKLIDDLGADSLDCFEITWNSRRNSTSRFLMKRRKRFSPSARPSTTSKPT